MTAYYRYRIETLEPVKMGGTGSQTNDETALDYIAGSTIRGAFIHEYLKLHPDLQLHEDPVERSRWLSGGIRFLNGYLLIDGHRGLPFPACFYTDKNELRNYRDTGKLRELVNIMEDVPGEAQKRIPPKGYVIFKNDGQLYWANTEKTNRLHINLQEEQTQLYHYEAIAGHQELSTVVAVDAVDDRLDAFFRSLNGKTMYFGGSKSSGYGKCRLSFIEKVMDNPEKVTGLADDGDCFYVYCLSDVILRDSFGRFSARITDQYMTEKLGMNIKSSAASVQVASVSGFNQKWGCRTPHVQCIQKGSVFLFQAEGRLDRERLQRVQDEGIGERTCDGFGRVLFLSSFHPKGIERFDDSTDVQPELVSMDDKRGKAARGEVDALAKKIVIQRLIDKQSDKLLEWEKHTEDRRISNFMLSNWMNLCNRVRLHPPAEGKREIHAFIDHLQNRSSGTSPGRPRENDKAFRSLKSASINGRPWLEFVQGYVEQADDVDQLFDSLDVAVPSIECVDGGRLIDAHDAWALNMTMLFNYFREHRRQRSRGGEK